MAIQDWNLTGYQLFVTEIKMKSHGGLILPNGVQDMGGGITYFKALVHGVGKGKISANGVRTLGLVKEGDTVLLIGEPSQTMTLDGETYLLADESMVIAYKSPNPKEAVFKSDESGIA